MQPYAISFRNLWRNWTNSIAERRHTRAVVGSRVGGRSFNNNGSEVMQYNKVILCGNLTRDVETKSVNNTTLAHFGLAVNRKYTPRDGEQREETTFVEVEAWDKVAETLAQHLSKGSPAFIEGRLKLDQWQDNNGNNRSKLKVVVSSFQFVGDKGQQSGGSQSNGSRASNGSGQQTFAGTKPRRKRPATSAAAVDSGQISEDDIPF